MVDNRVYSSTINPHYAQNADWAEIAQTAEYANNAAYANVAEYASNLPTPLEGMTFNFTNNAAIYESLSVLITMLGGTVTNMPEKALTGDLTITYAEGDM